MATLGENANYISNSIGDSELIDWVPLSLTLVEYPKGDLIGKFLALISLAPFGIGAGFVSLILFRRDLHTITFFLGTLFNEAFNYFLKHSICEERPMSRNTLYTEYGMPSSHAQFVWFFTTYVVYFVFIRLHHMNNNNIIETMSKILILSSSLIMSLLVCISRIYLQYHSFSQVIVGSIVGVLFASFWFALTYFAFTPLFPQIVTWDITSSIIVMLTIPSFEIAYNVIQYPSPVSTKNMKQQNEDPTDSSS